MERKSGDLLFGLLIGGLAGVVAGILFAPKSGKETREDLAKGAEALLAKAKEEYDRAVEASRRTYEETVRGIRESELAERVEEVEQKIKEVSKDSAGRFKRALEAGVSAYKETGSDEGKG